MCGICGIVGCYVEIGRLRAATDLMRHRGPDEAGFFHEGAVALGMRRLSIIDVGGGSQPKSNESGSIQVIFNGEIYNFGELRRQLVSLGHSFSSDSDTEVIAHAYEHWGTDSFARLNGIFAIALWSADDRTLVLARDHLGVKPLYYSLTSGSRSVAFASELTPLLALMSARPAIDPSALASYLRFGYVPAPRSIYQGMYKLQPGHWLRVREDQDMPEIREFWSPLTHASRMQTTISGADAEELVDSALADAVKRQLVSDVPLGAFLSGGTDSSVVVAMMRRVSNHTPMTFSIGFEERDEDESVYAGEVAAALETRHHSITITESDALDVIPQLPRYFDEPFADSSAIPTYLVSQLARRFVTVSLSGDGGDELFGGYSRYQLMRRLRHWWNLPFPVQSVTASALARLPGPVGALARRGDHVLRAGSLGDAYRGVVSITPDTVLDSLVRRPTDASRFEAGWPSDLFHNRGLDEAMMLTDLVTYLPGDILTKVDRASMAHSLEARVPLLDVKLVEAVVALPPAVRLQDGPKSLLKRVLARYVPRPLIDRPKHGFSIPLHRWLRAELRQCMTDYLTPEAVRSHGLWDPSVMERMMKQHLDGERNRGHALWALLMFQMWYEHSHLADLATAQARDALVNP